MISRPDESLRYPIGRFLPARPPNAERRAELIDSIADTGHLLRRLVSGLSDTRLETPYRPGGWTVRQVVHHLADSHVNSYVRCKLAATEDEPFLRLYDETRWAELADARSGPLDASLDLVDSLHRRWVAFLRSLPAESYERRLRHPHHGVMTLGAWLQYCEWHARHHMAQISSLRNRMRWD